MKLSEGLSILAWALADDGPLEHMRLTDRGRWASRLFDRATAVQDVLRYAIEETSEYQGQEMLIVADGDEWDPELRPGLVDFIESLRDGRMEDMATSLKSPVEAEEGEAGSLTVRASVVRFGETMERKLRRNAWKGGWEDSHDFVLLAGLQGEVLELQRAITIAEHEHHYPQPLGLDRIIEEAADVANFAMMLLDNRAHGRGHWKGPEGGRDVP